MPQGLRQWKTIQLAQNDKKIEPWDIREKMNEYAKKLFLSGFSIGLKMGMQIDNRVKDFDFDKNKPLFPFDPNAVKNNIKY